ncbi:Endonuclease/exonuclease/phosphatase [Lyophyllum atratum]|nr:Endonuclease/exonuclease/phosphatase [Lyophyllum atratum]
MAYFRALIRSHLPAFQTVSASIRHPQMAPKRQASKRKASSSDEEVDEIKTTKRSKKVASESTDTSAQSRQPTNKVLPVSISQKKGFKYYVEAEDADILVLTETKPADPVINKRYPHCYWSISDKKTYSGIAVLSKRKPLNATMTLPGHPDPKLVKGRIITLEFETCYLISTYVVNAGTGLKTLDAKKEWNIHFEAYIRDLDKKKPVIWTGDLNVAPTEMDLAKPKTNWNKTPGYTEAETTSFKNILNPPESTDAGQFVDVWRHLHPTDRHYSYFSYRFNCREKGIGWRLDMFVLSQRIMERAKMCEIRSEIYGASDHCPVVMEYDIGAGL